LEILLYRRQFKCHTCKKPFSEALDFIGERRRYTDRFAEMIVKQVIHSDTHNVARNNGLTDDIPIMHRQKEAFRSIFEEAKDWTDGVFKLLDWLKDAQHTFRDSTATIGRWFEEISNYFESRTTSGAVEGINNRLKLIKRSGYGFRNFANFRLRCLICWHLTIS
jgi:transposase